jgi:hypothetical protein
MYVYVYACVCMLRARARSLSLSLSLSLCVRVRVCVYVRARVRAMCDLCMRVSMYVHMTRALRYTLAARTRESLDETTYYYGNINRIHSIYLLLHFLCVFLSFFPLFRVT